MPQAVIGCANKAIPDTMEQLRELRRQAAYSIVVPDMSKGGMGGLGAAARSRCLSVHATTC